jgi:hypothetical protein
MLFSLIICFFGFEHKNGVLVSGQTAQYFKDVEFKWQLLCYSYKEDGTGS